MPAPPEITVELNQEHFTRACEECGVKGSVDVRLRHAKGDELRGQAGPGRIDIFYGIESQAANRLLFVTTQITRTLLHELRHIWQFENWTKAQWDHDDRHSYGIKPSEVDARDWADRNVAKFRGLVRVRRQQASRLGRLSTAESRVRQRL